MGSESTNVLKVSTQKRPGSYVRAAQNFLHGFGEEQDPSKPVYDEIVISAIGNAICVATTAINVLELKKLAKVTKVETDYPMIEKVGNRAQLKVTLIKGEGVPEKPISMVPECPERLKEPKLEKKMKKVIKEGGKKGVEIEGAADMGGLKYFCTKCEEAGDDMDMLVETMKAMNAKSDPAEEERKGGSGHIGKCITSNTDDILNIVCYVSNTKEMQAKRWLKYIVENLDCGNPDVAESSNNVYAMISIKAEPDKNIFPLKMRDNVVSHAYALLKSKGLFPDADDDEDEFVFGDDDFP